jgi:UDP-N-acetylglucosamine:LPS N-acetylglucosamine transferase
MVRLLILTSHSGGGHVSLAEALRDRLAPGMSAAIADPLGRGTHLHYRFVSRHALGLWAAEYRATNTPAVARALHQVLAVAIRRRLGALIDEFQPSLVLSTCAVLTESVRLILARRERPMPLAILFADAERLHATWLTARDSAAVLAPTRESYHEALAAGFVPERLHMTGWPVRAQFTRVGMHDAMAMRARLQLDPDRFTVFVQGGGEGTAKIVRTVEHVLATGAAQVILAAGTNHALVERFGDAPGVRVFSFTPEIAPLMAAADVVLGKAGPNMLYEAVSLGKPFVATTYIPGQEAGNLAQIERYGLGWVALEGNEQQALLTALAQSPGMRASMRETVERHRSWNAAATASIGPLLRALCQGVAPAYRHQPIGSGAPIETAMGGNQ